MLPRSVRRPAAALPLLFVAIHPGVAVAQDSTSTPAYEEVPLFLRHRPEVATMVIGLFDGRRFYLPVIEILNHLQVIHSFDARAASLRVVIGHAQREYELDFAEARMRAGKNAVLLRRDQFIRRELEVYFTAELLEETVALRARIDPARLSVELLAREEMPVTAAARRRRTATLDSRQQEVWEAGTHYDRDRRVIDGAIAGYLLSVTDGGRANGELRLGMEVLGGALDAEGSGRRGEQGHAFQLRRAQWRFVFGSAGPVTQLSVGDIRGVGFLQGRLRGIELTNRPVEVRRVVATQVIEGEAHPGWDVEMLINGVVEERTTADALGRYRFNAPLGHGGSAIRLRLYGPDGEIHEHEHWFEVPFAFTPPGRLDYTIAGGRSDQGSHSAQADLAFGLTSRVTLNAQLYRSNRDESIVPARAGASLRLFRGYIGRLEASPGEQYRADLQVTSSSHARFSASYRQDERKTGTRSLGGREYGARAFVPLRRRGMNGTFRLDLLQRLNPGGPSQFLGAAEFSAAYHNVRPAIAYRLGTGSGPRKGRTQELRIGSAISVHRGHGVLRRLLLRASASYDLESGGLTAREITAHRGFSSGKALELAIRRSSAAAPSEFQVRLRVDRGWTRGSVTAKTSGTSRTIAQTASGSVSWDWRERRALFTSRSRYNSAGATLRLFLDDNANGVVDPGEEAITDYGIRLDRIAEVSNGRAGTVFVSDLAAYHRYRVRLLPAGNSNPLRIPYYETFSFIADPNRSKPIAVPFYAAGTVEGSAVRVIGGKHRPIAGLRVRVQEADGAGISVPVFGDGSFYYVGLRPGSYEARIDESQLSALGLVASPHSRRFDVRSDRNGDVIRALDFVLTAVEPK